MPGAVLGLTTLLSLYLLCFPVLGPDCTLGFDWIPCGWYGDVVVMDEVGVAGLVLWAKPWGKRDW